MVLNVDVLLVKVRKPDGRRLIVHYIVILSFFHGGHLENDPKWRVDDDGRPYTLKNFRCTIHE